MKKIFFVLSLVLIFNNFVFAQKHAKLKNEVVTFGDTEYFKFECKNPSIDNCLFKNLQAEKAILSKAIYWKSDYVPNHPQPIKRYFYEVEFWDTDLKMYTTESLSYFFKNLIEYQVYNEDGSLNYDKAAEFVKIYGEDKPEVLFID